MTKDSLTNAVDEGKSATQTLDDDLNGLGTPDTDAGKQAKSDVDQLRSELDPAQSPEGKLRRDSPAAAAASAVQPRGA